MGQLAFVIIFHALVHEVLRVVLKNNSTGSVTQSTPTEFQSRTSRMQCYANATLPERALR